MKIIVWFLKCEIMKFQLIQTSCNEYNLDCNFYDMDCNIYNQVVFIQISFSQFVEENSLLIFQSNLIHTNLSTKN